MNVNELRAEIARKGIQHNELADYIGISATAFSKKINGKNEFKLSEITKIAKMLDITPERRNEIFFTDEAS